MKKPLSSYYEIIINRKVLKIEKLQRTMNGCLNNPGRCLSIEIRQSVLKVEIIFIQRKLDMLKLKYGKAA